MTLKTFITKSRTKGAKDKQPRRKKELAQGETIASMELYNHLLDTVGGNKLTPEERRSFIGWAKKHGNKDGDIIMALRAFEGFVA